MCKDRLTQPGLISGRYDDLPGTVEADPPVTTLDGELSDQAALAGVLNTLYELHLTVTFGEAPG